MGILSLVMDLFTELKIYVNSFCDSAPTDNPYWMHVTTHIQALKNFCSNKSILISQDELKLHFDEIEKYIKENYERCTGGNYVTGVWNYAKREEVKNTEDKINNIKRIIAELVKLDLNEYLLLIGDEGEDASLDSCKTLNNCIFIGHGRSPLWNRINTWLKDNLKFDNVIYFESECRAGHYVGNILNKFLDQSTFAIIIMTAEDETNGDEIRARQNVIHEIGLFQGRLGFEKVAILKQEGVEPFSNIDGLQYIPFWGDNIQQAFWDLQEMLKRENIITLEKAVKDL